MTKELAPAITLVRPQLGMNIGMVARAMANFTLEDLRLVAPRDGWPNSDAGPAAAGADHVLDQAKLVDDVAEGLAGCQLTFATSVRPRHIHKPVVTPKEAVAKMREAEAQGLKSGILFGPERSGLTADDLAAVDMIITCPVNPNFGSLNLAQAVLLIAYEWFQSSSLPQTALPDHIRAPHEEVAGLIGHLVRDLDDAGYFHVPERTPATIRSLSHLISRAEFSSDEIRMLHGIIRALAEGRRR